LTFERAWGEGISELRPSSRPTIRLITNQAIADTNPHAHDANAPGQHVISLPVHTRQRTSRKKRHL